MPADVRLRATTRLRALLGTERLDFLMAVHDGISARIASEAGFAGLWASGLSLSAALGVRDNNEASWTQVLDQAEFMADAATAPILLDGDTGYGNFNNFRRFVRKLGTRGIAGVCIEDKIFPKTNSFLRGDAQPLAAVDEFCGKLKAGKDAQADDDFVIVARTEALIAGWGLAEALRRAEAYREAGADAIIVHSAKSRPDEVLAFLDAWANRHPVILIPTKYYTTPVELFAQRKVAAVIWGNHLLRAAIPAMQRAAARIAAERSVAGVEEGLAPLAEVFRLQGDDELREAEARYLAAAPRRGAIILAATRGSGALHPLTQDVPKTLLRVAGVSLLDRLCDHLSALNVPHLNVVAGYQAAAINRAGLRRFDNPAWATTGEVASLACAAEALAGPCLIAFGDILCRRYLLQVLLDDDADFVIAADRRIRGTAAEAPAAPRDLLRLAAAPAHAFLDGETTLAGAAFAADFAAYDAEWIGLLQCSARGTAIVRAWVEAARSRPDFARLAMVDLLADLVAQGHRVKVHLFSGDWTTIESAYDLAGASNL